MKVTVIGPTYPEAFAENIGNVLARAGAVVTHVDSRSRLTTVLARDGNVPRGVRAVERLVVQEARLRRRLLSGPLASRIAHADPDLVISTDGALRYEDLTAGRRVVAGSTPWVLWYPDHLGNLGAQDALAAGYDRLYFKDAMLVERLRQMTSLPASLLREACDPFRHHPVTPTRAEYQRYTCDLSLAGNMYPYRAEVLAQLPRSIDVRLFGNRARNTSMPADWFTEEYVTDRAKSLAFGCATAVLNTMHYAEIESVNARLFEATGCGALVLSEWRPGIDELFVDGEELLTFRTAQDMVSAWRTIEEMLPEERDSVRVAAVRRAHAKHTYVDRLSRMFEDLGLPQLSWVRHPPELICC